MFADGLLQYPFGAISPFETAQAYLDRGVAFAEANGGAEVAAMVALKLSAGNLLPYAGSRGFQMIRSLVMGSMPRSKARSG